MATKLCVDNRAAIKLWRNPVCLALEKQAYHHAIRDFIDRGKVDVVFISTKQILADALRASIIARYIIEKHRLFAGQIMIFFFFFFDCHTVNGFKLFRLSNLKEYDIGNLRLSELNKATLLHLNGWMDVTERRKVYRPVNNFNKKKKKKNIDRD